MKIKRVISVGHISDNIRGAQTTKHLTHNQRLSLVEDLLQQAVEVFHNEYSRRLSRVLNIVDQKRR